MTEEAANSYEVWHKCAVGRRLRSRLPSQNRREKSHLGGAVAPRNTSPPLPPPRPSPPRRCRRPRCFVVPPPLVCVSNLAASHMVLAGIFSAGAGADAIVRDGTDASPLLGRLLAELRDLFAAEVLPLLDPTDLTLIARASWECGEAVLSSGVEIAGESEDLPLTVKDFLGSVELLAWGKDNGCPWNAWTCAFAAEGGHLAVLQWAREHNCQWDEATCEGAAAGGHLAVLQWAREHGAPWDTETCAFAAEGGHLAVLQWARDHNCQWDERTCAYAAEYGHMEVMQWARDHGAPWEVNHVREYAAEGGHQEKRDQWLAEHGGP